MTNLTILDKALEYWLDRSLHLAIAHKIIAKGSRLESNPLMDISRLTLEAELFRNDLLHVFDDPKRLEKYFKGLTLSEMQRVMELSMGDNIFPYLLWKWCRDSRRVFELSAELQEALLAASFDTDLNFGDTTFPYQTFALKLHSPIRHPNSGQEYGFIMAHNMPASMSGNNRGTLAHYTLNTQLETYTPMTPAERMKCRSLPPTLGMKRVEKSLGKVLEMSHAVFGGMSYANATSLAKAEVEASKQNIGTPMSRLIIGFMLYWQTLPPGSPSRSDWHGSIQPPTPNQSSVTDRAMICSVSAGGLVTSDATEGTTTQPETHGGPPKYELPTHERGSYWRRAPGTGNDPNAPRAVYVKQTTVRADRLRPGELPAGTLAVATSRK